MRTQVTTRLAALAIACAVAVPAFAGPHDHFFPEPPRPGIGHFRAPRPHRPPLPPLPHPAMLAPPHFGAGLPVSLPFPARGAVVPVLPPGGVRVGHGGVNWYFQGGSWYRPVRAGYAVGMPPPGLIVPMLPPACTTVWIGGTSYYYANDVYYTAAPGGYSVVAPPPGAAAAQLAASGAPVIYPRDGQGPAQQQADLRACDQWASVQPGATADGSLFMRAEAACMDARGYSER